MKFLKLMMVSVACLLLITACKKEATQELAKLNCDPFPADTYSNLGTWHNDFLTNIKDKFKPISGLDYNEKIDYIKEFNQDYISQLNLNATDADALKAEFSTFKDLVNRKIAHERFFVETDFLPNHDLYGALGKLKQNDFIDDFEEGIVTAVLDLTKANYQGTISIPTLKEQLQALQNKWVAQGYTQCEKHGRFSLMILSIGLSSVDWWLDNPEIGLQRVAPWVAADVGGAIYGAAAGAIGSVVVGGEFSWGATGWASLAGAVGASTGIAGKIGKWLFK